MTKKIQFDDALKVGVESIDTQHRVLFDLANDLNTAVKAGASKQIVDTLFQVILNYAFNHFELEENALADKEVSASHCLRHYRLLRELQNYAVDFRNNRTREKDPGDFLEEWLIDHIREYDMPSFSPALGQTAFPDIGARLEEFDQQEIDKRKHKRIRHEKVLDEDIIGHIYNANTLKSGTATVVDLSSGGLKLYSELKIDIGDLLVVSCRVGKIFTMKEKVWVKNSNDNFYGVEFVSPAEETVRFLTELCGAVHKYY